MIDIAMRLSSAVDAPEDRLSNTTGTVAGTRKKPGILVVDDEEGVRGVLEIGLRLQGFTVWPARSGQEGIDLYRRHRETIDLVLLDVRMPGLDGPHTLAALQEVEPRVPCCFMSGDIDSYADGQLGKLGAASVIRKPFDLAEVMQMLWDMAISAASQLGRNLNDGRPSLRME
jgi:DNA-binding NtrC family response regulator